MSDQSQGPGLWPATDGESSSSDQVRGTAPEAPAPHSVAPGQWTPRPHVPSAPGGADSEATGQAATFLPFAPNPFVADTGAESQSPTVPPVAPEVEPPVTPEVEPEVEPPVTPEVEPPVELTPLWTSGSPVVPDAEVTPLWARVPPVAPEAEVTSVWTILPPRSPGAEAASPSTALPPASPKPVEPEVTDQAAMAPPAESEPAAEVSFTRKPWVRRVSLVFVALVVVAAAVSVITPWWSNYELDAANERNSALAAKLATATKQLGDREAQTRANEAAVAKAVAATATISGDGTFAIVSDRAPGTYKTLGPVSGSCYYAVRRSPASDTVDNIIDSNNIAGPGVVTLQAGQYFESKGCQDWTKS